MAESEMDAVNRRAAIHFHAWCALSSLALAVDAARGSARELTALDAYATVQGLLDEVEREAADARAPLVRPPLFRGKENP
jgi:hypothetical protein